MEERIYNVSLSKIYMKGRHRERANRVMKFIRAFAKRHMKAPEDKIVIGTDVNEYVWRNGIQKPPKRIRLRMMKDKDGTVMVTLEGQQAKKESFEKKKNVTEKEPEKEVKKKGEEKGTESKGEKKKKGVSKVKKEKDSK